MTIKELYEWSKRFKCEDYDLIVPYISSISNYDSNIFIDISKTSDIKPQLSDKANSIDLVANNNLKSQDSSFEIETTVNVQIYGDN